MTVWVHAGSFVLQCLKTIQLHRILQNHVCLQICNTSSLYVHVFVLPACQQKFILFSSFQSWKDGS